MQTPAIKPEIGEALRDIQKGIRLGLPLSRPMPTITSGAHKLRIRDSTTAIWVLYFVAVSDAIVVFLSFQEQTQQTLRHEIDLGQRRLKEMLDGSI